MNEFLDYHELMAESEAGYEACYSVIHEVFFGKTKEIQAIEKKIGEIRSKYQTNQMKANTSKEKADLEDMLCDAFGFKCCSLHIDPTPSYNAYTYPISSSVFDFRDFRKLIVSKNGVGVKYKPEANIYLIVAVTKGLMFSSLFSDAEVTALILHEIGHNFQTAMSGKCRNLNMINKAFNLLLAPIIILTNPQSGPFRNNYIDFIKKIEKDFTGFADCYWMIKNLVITALSIGVGALMFISNITVMMNPLAVIQSIPREIMSRLNIDLLFLPAGVKSEIVSDAFATAYGYGAELSSGLSKIERTSGGVTPNQLIRDIPFIGSYFDLLNLPSKLICNVFDPHPNSIARMKNQLDYAKQELVSKETNPKMKKELQKQISEIERTMDKYLEIEEGDGFMFSKGLDTAMLGAFNGDIRNAMAKGTNQEFDQAVEMAKHQIEMAKRKKIK